MLCSSQSQSSFNLNRKIRVKSLVTLSRSHCSSSLSPSSFQLSSSCSFIAIIYRIFVILSLSSLGSLYPNCKCVKFTGTYNKDYGIFTSPDWPIPYEPGIDCLLYIFSAQDDQLIEISFDSFDVYTPSTSTDCSKSDFVGVNLNPSNRSLNREDISSSSKQSDLLMCGKSLPHWLRKHFSRDSLLVLEFHSGSIRSQSRGFSGTYKFLNKTMYTADGEHLPGTQCDYQFLGISSSQHPSPSSGKFFSPDYPSRYPLMSNCAYHFMGKYNEKVKIVFEKITFGNLDSSCLDTADTILVYDGQDTKSPLIAQLCNDDRFLELISSGPDLLVVFRSGIKSPSPLAQGFEASYTFNQSYINPSHQPDLHYHQDHRHDSVPFTPSSTRISSESSDNQDIDHQKISSQDPEEAILSKDETKTPTKSFTCDQHFHSELSRNGSFHSPNYPDPYPSGVRCRYSFSGLGKERVQISFNDFDLGKGSTKIKTLSCEGSDTLMALLTINGNKESLDNFCGNTVPKNLMSNGPNLLLEFRSGHSSKKNKGFQAYYRFVTNFGINSGEPDTVRGVCAFVFNSTKASNGTFASPNFPGLYPRDTECQYFFYGKPNEQVHLSFVHFDIEGVPPCTAESASDYIEFSNYQTVDRKLPRHCGFRKPKSIISDHQFFRVIFKSNDKFDGTGFEAYYQFRDSRKDNSGARRLSSSGTKNTSNLLFVIMIMLILHRII